VRRQGRAARQTRSAIGTDACICADAFVGPGVTVNDGVILEAAAIVLKDVKPWMIVVEKYSTRLRGDLSQNDLRYHPDAQ
jgi:acetyltransferase-like isoleucine patch superfamily enzyme